MITALLLLRLAAATAAAHDYPIKPVRAVLRVEPDRVALDLDGDSIYWIEEVLAMNPVKPRDWPADVLARAEKYVNEHARLTADGKPLAGRLIDAVYVQKPWEVYEQGRVRLRMVYPPVADGATLSGEMDFFEDYRQERLAGKEPILPKMEFRTHLEIPGRSPRAFDLTPGAWTFSIPAADARRGAAALLLESFRAGAATALTEISGWAALAALALSLGPLAPSRARAGVLLAALLAAAPWPGAAPAWLPWAAGLAAAVSAGRWFGERAAPPLEAAALAALGRFWSADAAARLPRAVPGGKELAAASVGLLAVAVALLAAGGLAVAFERRNLSIVSESRAPELFERRRRLAATVLLLACGYGLFQSLPR